MNDSSEKIQAVDAIRKKLLGKELTSQEIYSIMDEIAHNHLSDILTTYFVAASFREGFTSKELYYFTDAMVKTGNTLHFDGIVADKHCIGGIAGTRTTMILVPIIAAAGFKIPKISSRAITTPAGTADTMELLAHVNFPLKKVHEMVETIGGCIIWNGSMGIAPADDIIIRVEEPLSFESFDKIIVSVMSKKIAVGTNHLIIDLPIGKTMKIKNAIDAHSVADKFQFICDKFGIKLTVDINETHEPAGNGIGPLLEARDVLLVLEQSPLRPVMLEKRSLKLAADLLDLCYKDAHIKKDGHTEALSILQSGKALIKFKEIINAQEGNDQITSKDLKPSPIHFEIKAERKGKIKEINNLHLNALAKILGAPVDKQAGMYLVKKIHDTVDTHDTLIIFYSSDTYRLKEAIETYKNLPIFGINEV